MELHDKLKLLRSLYCLSQEEIASLSTKFQRSVYAAAESGLRELSLHHAESLCRRLNFDDTWLAGKNVVQPLQGQRVLILDMDWSNRYRAVTPNVRSRRLHEVYEAVRTLLPDMLRENKPVYCHIYTSKDDYKLTVFIFKQQALALRTVPGQPISSVIDAVVLAVAKEADNKIRHFDLVDDDSAKLSEYSVSSCLALLIKLGVFKENCQQTPADMAASHFDYDLHFGGSSRQTLIKKICDEIRRHELTPEEIMKGLGVECSPCCDRLKLSRK